MIAALVLALLAVVNSTNSTVSYACNGGTSTFTVNFPYQNQNDLMVTNVSSLGVPTTLALTTDYRLSATSTSTVATLTILNPAVKCAAGTTLKITRVMPLTQPTSFKMQTSFSPAVFETALDRLAMQLQQVISNTGVTPDGSIMGDGTVIHPLGINPAFSNSWTVPQTIGSISATPALTLQGGNSTASYGLQATGGNSTTAGAPGVNAVGGCGTLSCGPGVNASGGTKGPGIVATGSAVRGSVAMTPQARPSTPSEGDVYQDSTTHRSYVWNGSIWSRMDLGVDFSTVANNLFYAGPNGGGPLAPTFRALDGADVTTGTIAQARGGTGAGALTCAAGQHITSNGTAYSCSADTGGIPNLATQHAEATSSGCATGAGTDFATFTVANTGLYLILSHVTVSVVNGANATLTLKKNGTAITGGTSVGSDNGASGTFGASLPINTSVVASLTAADVIKYNCAGSSAPSSTGHYSASLIQIQ